MYKIYRFDDDTVLELPKDTNDETFRYLNKCGQWETNEQGVSSEMEDKIQWCRIFWSERFLRNVWRRPDGATTRDSHSTYYMETDHNY